MCTKLSFGIAVEYVFPQTETVFRCFFPWHFLNAPESHIKVMFIIVNLSHRGRRCLGIQPDQSFVVKFSLNDMNILCSFFIALSGHEIFIGYSATLKQPLTVFKGHLKRKIRSSSYS